MVPLNFPFKSRLRLGVEMAYGWLQTRVTRATDAVCGIGKDRLLFIGDSHAQMFQYIKREKLLKGFFVQTLVVPGATAQGMANPHSKTNALEVFKKTLGNRRYKAIFIQLGEVDCGFVVWHRCAKYGESIEFQLKRSLENYFNFVRYLLDRGHERIILTGAVLPTIKDNGVSWGEVAHLRSEVRATRKERTDLTLSYNDSLRKFAVETGIAYIDITRYVLDQQTGLVADEYLNENPLDHHLSAKKVARFWIREIEHCLGRNSGEADRAESPESERKE